MGKKKDQSLTERIGALISRVGEKPEPTFAYIKGELVDCRSIAQSLEDGAPISEAEAKLEAAQTALERANTQNAKIESELQAAHSEIKKFRDEQKKREEKKREIDPIQFRILERLGNPTGCEWLRIDEISRALKIPVDEVVLYMEGLDDLGLVFFHPHEPGGGGWLRTSEGNKLVVAKRWAGETEQKKQYNYANLPDPIQQEALLQLAEGELTEREIIKLLGKTPRLVRRHLHSLRDAKMATDEEENPGSAMAAFGDADVETDDSPMWRILRDGEEYLAERDLL